jgi:hypothetical protein
MVSFFQVSAMATYGSTQVSIQPGQQPSIVVTQEPSAASVPQEDERPAAADQVAEIREVDAETTSRVEKGKQAKEAKRKKKLEQKKPEASNQEDGDLLLGEGDDVGVREMIENDELSELLSSPEDLHGLSGKLQARLGGSDEGMCFDPKSVSWKGNESDLDAFDDSEVPASDAGELCASREAARANSGDEFALSAADEEALRSAARESDELQDWYRDGTAPWSDAEAQPLPAASEGQ